MLSLIKTHKVSGKAVLALFSQEQLWALFILNLELGPFLLDATGAALDHMVDGDVAGLDHGIEVEVRRSGGMYRASDPESLPAAITGRLKL